MGTTTDNSNARGDVFVILTDAEIAEWKECRDLFLNEMHRLETLYPRKLVLKGLREALRQTQLFDN
jgi:hypothetical protein